MSLNNTSAVRLSPSFPHLPPPPLCRFLRTHCDARSHRKPAFLRFYEPADRYPYLSPSPLLSTARNERKKPFTVASEGKRTNEGENLANESPNDPASLGSDRGRQANALASVRRAKPHMHMLFYVF